MLNTNNSTDNVSVFYDMYKESLNKYNIPFEEIRDIIFADFDKVPFRDEHILGELVMRPKYPNFNIDKNVFDDYFFATNYGSNHVHINSVTLNKDKKIAPSKELDDSFDCYIFGDDNDSNIIYNHIYVDKIDENETLFIEKYLNKNKTDIVYSLDIYSNFKIDYFKSLLGKDYTHQDLDDFAEKIKSLRPVTPAANLSIIKEDSIYKVIINYDEPRLNEMMEYDNDELKIEDKVPVSDTKSNYEQVKAISNLYYNNFIAPSLGMVEQQREEEKRALK